VGQQVALQVVALVKSSGNRSGFFVANTFQIQPFHKRMAILAETEVGFQRLKALKT
jgi:hypothetical protein